MGKWWKNTDLWAFTITLVMLSGLALFLFWAWFLR